MDSWHRRPPTAQRTLPRRWGLLRPALAAVLLGALFWRLGTEPFLQGLSRVDAPALVTACVVAVVTTWCCAWRWSLVAHRLGVEVPVPSAVAACYRSQFLNLATPGGLVGDVERGLRHGRVVRDTGAGLRSVVWERLVGQVVLFVMAGSALVLLPSPVRRPVRVGVVAIGVVVLVVGGVSVLRRLLQHPTPLRRPSRATAVLSRAGGDVRAVLLDPHTCSRVLLTSVVAVVGHVVTFLVAARTAGAGGPTLHLLPLALVVILAMGLPNIAGWGPREGAAAWTFGVGGLGAQQGVATAVVYGVMVLVGALPGAVVLLVAGAGRHRVGHRVGCCGGRRG